MSKKNDHLESFNRHLLKYNRSNEQIDELKELIELKVLRDELKEKIEELKALLKERNSEYETAWARLTHYRKVAKDLTGKTKELKEEVDGLTTQLKFETSTRIEELTAANANAEWWKEQNLTQHEMLAHQESKINDLVSETNKKKNEFDKIRECMGKMNEQHKRSKEGLEHSNRKKDKEIQTLSDRLAERSRELTGAKKEAADTAKEMKEDKKQIEKLKVKNKELDSKVSELEKRVDALNRNKELDATIERLDNILEDLGPSLAETEKPGPQKEGEREESRVSVAESSYSEMHTTTGGIAGDSDGDTESLNVTEDRPQKGARKKEYYAENRKERSDRSSEESQDSQDSNQSRNETQKRKRES